MKLPLISLILLLILQFNSTRMFSQDQEKKSYKNNITFNVTRLALLEARFGYERHLSDRHVLRTSLGIQFPVSSNSFPSYFFSTPYYYAVSKGMYIALGYNYILSLRSKFYISPEVYFNYNNYDNKYFKNCVGQDKESYVSLQSMNLTKSGIKLLLGKKFSMSPKKETRLQFDFFTGIGIQYRQEEITVFKKKGDCYSIDGEYTEYDPPRKEISNKWYPTLHAGILLSLPF